VEHINPGANSMRVYKLMAPVLFLGALSANAWAGLVGTSVTGSLTFGNVSTNYFDSSNNFVPSGCANSGAGGTTVTVTDPTAEFCFLDPVNRDTANFSDTSLTITDISISSIGPFTMSFVLAPGVVTSVSELSDTFASGGLSFSFVGNQLTISLANSISSPGTYSAVYAFSAAAATVPEPTTLSMAALLIALAGSLSLRRRGNGA
jgi:hypothetical protein